MSDPFIAKPFKAAPNLKKLTVQDATLACEKLWLEFFSRLQRYENTAEPVDLAIWEIHALSCRVMCRPGSSYRDENDPAIEAPGMIFFLAPALEKKMRTIFIAMSDSKLSQRESDRQLEDLENQFFDLLIKAVLNSFESPSVQKQFRSCKAALKQFSIFATRNDEGLDSSSLTLIWKNKLGVTAEQVREKAIKLRRGSSKKKVVKKSPAKLRAEGRTKNATRKSPAKKKPSPKSTAGTLAKKLASGKALRRVKANIKTKSKTKK